MQVSFRSGTSERPAFPSVDLDDGPSARASTARPQQDSLPPPSTPLNDRYTFERFVIGNNNQLAAAA
jgi:chromosomal replication initiation ATPase DnaA